MVMCMDLCEVIVGLEETALYYVSLEFKILKRRQHKPRMSHRVEYRIHSDNWLSPGAPCRDKSA